MKYYSEIYTPHDGHVLFKGNGNTATSAITSAGKDSKKSNRQINATCAVRVFESGAKILDVSGYGVEEAIKRCHATNRKLLKN